MKIQEFQKILKNKPESERNTQFFLSILIHHFLGENWYSIFWNQSDINAEAVYDILRRYPKRSMKGFVKGFFHKWRGVIIRMNNEAAENEKKKEYLKGYEREIRKMERCKIKIEEMRLQQIYPSVSSDGMPHAHAKNDLSSFVSMLDQEERRYKKANYLRVKKCKEITDKIERLENEDEKDVLLYRYIKLMKWEKICEKMGFSWKHIHRIHSKALKNFIMT